MHVCPLHPARNDCTPAFVVPGVPAICFVDDVNFDVTTGEVRRSFGVIRLEPQPAAVLAALAARPGQLLTHEELRRAVWGEATHIKLHDALHYCIRQIRAALGDTARDPRFIETVPRRGYRLRADCLASARPIAPDSPTLRRRWALFLAVAAALVVTVAELDRRPNNHHEIAVKVAKTLHALVF